MNRSARELLRKHLAQRAELGERFLILEGLAASEALALAARPPVRSRPGPEAAVAAPAGQAPAPASAGALFELGREAGSCTRCRLHKERRSVVFGTGDPGARVVVVGEAPGQEEDRTGEPFVGRAGKLLDQLLMSAGFPRESVYICNVLKCRPPQNRNPLPDEVATCSPYLHGQLELIAPRVLVAVGKFAAQTLLETDTSIGRLRGQVHAYRGVPLVATFHPAYLLRSPQWIRAAWQDFQLVRQILDRSAGAPGAQVAPAK